MRGNARRWLILDGIAAISLQSGIHACILHTSRTTEPPEGEDRDSHYPPPSTAGNAGGMRPAHSVET
jgi:hypothetical protein